MGKLIKAKARFLAKNAKIAKYLAVLDESKLDPDKLRHELLKLGDRCEKINNFYLERSKNVKR